MWAPEFQEKQMDDYCNKEILSEREVSRWLGISEPTLFRHRRDGTGPSFIRLSERRVGYRRIAVEEWLAKRECQKIAAV
jgi:predicted DNA-binding transcriptional regulator AlpA